MDTIAIYVFLIQGYILKITFIRHPERYKDFKDILQDQDVSMILFDSEEHSEDYVLQLSEPARNPKDRTWRDNIVSFGVTRESIRSFSIEKEFHVQK